MENWAPAPTSSWSGGGTVGGWGAIPARAGRPGVVLVEARTLGQGASSRAAGMVRAQGGTETAVRLACSAATSTSGQRDRSRSTPALSCRAT